MKRISNWHKGILVKYYDETEEKMNLHIFLSTDHTDFEHKYGPLPVTIINHVKTLLSAQKWAEIESISWIRQEIDLNHDESIVEHSHGVFFKKTFKMKLNEDKPRVTDEQIERARLQLEPYVINKLTQKQEK